MPAPGGARLRPAGPAPLTCEDDGGDEAELTGVGVTCGSLVTLSSSSKRGELAGGVQLTAMDTAMRAAATRGCEGGKDGLLCFQKGDAADDEQRVV